MILGMYSRSRSWVAIGGSWVFESISNSVLTVLRSEAGQNPGFGRFQNVPSNLFDRVRSVKPLDEPWYRTVLFSSRLSCPAIWTISESWDSSSASASCEEGVNGWFAVGGWSRRRWCSRGRSVWPWEYWRREGYPGAGAVDCLVGGIAGSVKPWTSIWGRGLGCWGAAVWGMNPGWGWAGENPGK